MTFSVSPPYHRPLPSFPTRRSSDLHHPDGILPRQLARDVGGPVLGGVVHHDDLRARERRADALHQRGQIVGLVIGREDRKSTRLNSSHLVISYAVFCLKKKTTQIQE